MEFENKKTHKGIHYSRYIASYMNEENRLGVKIFRSDVYEWLEDEGLTGEEINDILWIMFCGRMELETSVYKFITKKQKVPS